MIGGWEAGRDGVTYEGGRAGAEAGEGQQAVSGLLGGYQDVLLWVQKGGQQLDGALLQDLDVQGHPLGVALQRPHLQAPKSKP